LDPVTFVTFQEILFPKSSWEYNIDSIKAIPVQIWKHGKSCWPFFKEKNEYVVTPKKEKL
jgi:hypothetical protein